MWCRIWSWEVFWRLKSSSSSSSSWMCPFNSCPDADRVVLPVSIELHRKPTALCSMKAPKLVRRSREILPLHGPKGRRNLPHEHLPYFKSLFLVALHCTSLLLLLPWLLEASVVLVVGDFVDRRVVVRSLHLLLRRAAVRGPVSAPEIGPAARRVSSSEWFW